jgi:hypothetical protein
VSRRKRKRRQNSWGSWADSYNPARAEVVEQLQPLILQIRRVDDLTEKIRRGEGCVRDLKVLQDALQQPVSIPGSVGRQVALCRPHDIHNALYGLSRELHLEVHAMDGYPCYLLCRIDSDWDTPDTILDELYVSSRNDFFPDEHFVVLSRSGRSRTFLRLSIFRDRLREYLAGRSDQEVDEQECDEVLQAVAKLVIGAAWYEDQRLPFHVAGVFGLKWFRAALELVSFVLGSDLYRVATALREETSVAEFFEHVFENRPLAALLGQLHGDTMLPIAALEDRAREAFVELNRVFSNFLGTVGALLDLECLELYKIALGCFYHLREVAAHDTWTPALKEVIDQAEAEAAECIRSVLVTIEPAGLTTQSSLSWGESSLDETA